MPPKIVVPRSATLAPAQSRVGRLLGAKIVGVGSSLPEGIVANQDLAIEGYDPKWIARLTGIEQRRLAGPEQATSDLAAEAARQCLAQADVDPAEVDLVVVATSTPDYPMPSTAALVQDRLGLRAMAYDLQAACAGFVYGLMCGMQHVISGAGRAALVIGAECQGRIVNPADEQTYPLFGDGAAAVLVTPGAADQGWASFVVGSDGSGAELLMRAMGGTRVPYVAAADDPRRYLAMQGEAIFKWAVRTIVQTTRQALDAAGVTLDEIELFLFHQANLRILQAAADDLGLDARRMLINLDRYGNTGAASIPLLLAEAQAEGRLRRGGRVLLCGFGGGLAWGTAVMQW